MTNPKNVTPTNPDGSPLSHEEVEEIKAKEAADALVAHDQEMGLYDD